MALDLMRTPSASRNFKEVLIPAFRAFRSYYAKRAIGLGEDTKRASAVAQSLLDLPEQVFLDKKDELPFKTPREYREELWKVSSNYELVCDVANAWKHGKVSRQGRKIAGPSAIIERIALIEAEDEEGAYVFSRKLLVVELESGEKVELAHALVESANLWAGELRARGVLGRLVKFKSPSPGILDRHDPRGKGEMRVNLLAGEPDAFGPKYYTFRSNTRSLVEGKSLNSPISHADVELRIVARKQRNEI